MVRRLTVYGVNHHLTWCNLLDSLEPRENIIVRGVIHVHASIRRSLHEHRLYDALAIESLHILDNLLHILVCNRTVNIHNVLGIYRVKLEDVIVNLEQSFTYFRFSAKCCV